MKFMVAFSSPKRSARVVERAAMIAKATDSELVLVRIIPDPEKVGVVAQLISTAKPIDKAQQQIDEVVGKLKEQGINASGMVRVGEVTKSLVRIASDEVKADVLFVGTTNVGGKAFFLMEKDPIVHYLVDHCSASLYLVRHEPGDALDDTIA